MGQRCEDLLTFAGLQGLSGLHKGAPCAVLRCRRLKTLHWRADRGCRTILLHVVVCRALAGLAIMQPFISQQRLVLALQESGGYSCGFGL